MLAIADDWAWPHAGVAGDKVVRTPAFDRLARAGVLFTQAFVSAPSCSPSRAALLTGQHFWRLEEGAILWSTLPAKFPVYPDLLEQAGYHVGHTGKGWGPGPIAPGGRQRNPAGPLYKSFQQFLEARPPGKPFCFWFGSFRPHRHYQWQSGVQAGLKPEQVSVPSCLPDAPDVRTDLCDNPFGDIDGSPTKYFMLKHRDQPAVRPLFELAFAQRPAEELYDLRTDPDQLHNVATDSRHTAAKTRLAEALMSELKATKDPRVLGRGGSFDEYPYYWGPNAPGRVPAKPPPK